MLRFALLILSCLLIATCGRKDAVQKKVNVLFAAPWGNVSLKGAKNNQNKKTEIKPPVKKNIKTDNTRKQIINVPKADKKTDLKSKDIKKSEILKPKKIKKKSTVCKITPKEEKQTIVIAGSRPNTAKFNIAGSICRYINNQPHTKFRCLVETTPNVKYSLQNSKKYDFIISQTNLDQKFRYKRNGLTSMFALFPETFNLIVSEKSGINVISDLKGKKIYVGQSESSAGMAFAKVLQSVNLKTKDVKFQSGANMAHKLCNDEIDAIFTDVRGADIDVDTFLSMCGAKLISLDNSYIKRLIKDCDEYIYAEVPDDLYPSYKKTTPSFGIMTNLIATSKVSDETAFEITRMIFDNIQQFKLSDQALLDITVDEMTVMNYGLIFPIHPGAEKYYKEHNIKHTLPNKQ